MYYKPQPSDNWRPTFQRAHGEPGVRIDMGAPGTRAIPAEDLSGRRTVLIYDTDGECYPMSPAAIVEWLRSKRK